MKLTLAAALILFALLGIPFREYLTDDTFIFLRFASNLASGGGFAFNPGEPVYGFTSPLWVLILAASARIGLPPLLAAKALAWVCGAAAVLGFAGLARRRLPRATAGWATCAFAANAWLVRWTGAAMETALAVALIVWGLERQAAESEDDGLRPVAAFLLALAVLARPETALLLGMALAAAALGSAAARRRALAGAGITALVLVPWFAYAELTFGTLLPVTAEAKGRLEPGTLEFTALVSVAKSVGATSGLEAVLLGAGAVAWLARRREGGGGSSAVLVRRHGPALGWLVALPVLYVVTGFDVLSRYALPIVPVTVLYGFRALGRFIPGPALRKAAAALFAAVLIQNVLVLTFLVYPHTHRLSRGVKECWTELGRWVAANTPPGTAVAIADIGAFGYYSERRVLDLAGLVSPELLPIVNDHPIEEIAAGLLFADLIPADRRPAYLVDRHGEPERLAPRMGGTFESVRWCRVEGLGVRSPAPVTYTLYRLHWDRFEAFVSADSARVRARGE